MKKFFFTLTLLLCSNIICSEKNPNSGSLAKPSEIFASSPDQSDNDRLRNRNTSNQNVSQSVNGNNREEIYENDGIVIPWYCMCIPLIIKCVVKS